MNREIDLTVGETGDGLIEVIVRTPECEISILLTKHEFHELPRVRHARWTARESLQLGKTAGSPTFWSCEDGKLNILVGQDDKAWDIAVVLPSSMLDKILPEIA